MEEGNQRDKRTGEEAGIVTSENEPKPKRSHRAIQCISEKDVGITAYVTEEKGIRGILKDSCEDFIVQEIDEQGHVVNLVNQEIPFEEQEDECKMSEEEGWKILHSYFDDSTCQSIESFMNQVKADPNTMEKCKLPSLDDKNKRKEIHGVIRCAFPCLVSDTEEDCIVLHSYKNQNVYHKTKRSSWPHPDKDYVKFTLKKKGKDTMNCINSIAHILHRAPKMFSYYGTKDKRAVTYQHVVAYRILPKDIKNAVGRLKDIEVGDYQFVAEPASIGKNQGNRFTILLHGIQDNNQGVSLEELQQRLTCILSKLQETGYLNYFGLQRFGHEGNNIPIGCHLLRSEWKEAFYKILRSGTNTIIEKAITKFEESQDGVAAANLLPKFMSNEIILLKALGKSGGKGFSNAIAAIPFNRRSMYIHSIQSLLFNHFVSIRIEMGLSLQPGDFVCTASENELTDKTPIIVITEENKKDYSIQQLVLPLPGLSTQLPCYLKEEYSKILKQLNLEEDCWSKCVQDYQMHGTYRRMLLIPKELEGSIHDDTLQLSFSLDSGCYATMLIREVTKYETDVKSQLALFLVVC